MIKFCKSREICTATKCFTSQQFNSPLAFEQFFYSTLKIDWLFSNQMADSLWKSRPEFIPSIIVYSIAFVVSLDIFIVKNQTTNLSSASYTCHCTIYIVNREQKHPTKHFDKFIGAQHLKLCFEAHYRDIFIKSFNLLFILLTFDSWRNHWKV